jgi:hypothetical protein
MKRCETNVDENFKLATPFPPENTKKTFPDNRPINNFSKLTHLKSLLVL